MNVDALHPTGEQIEHFVRGEDREITFPGFRAHVAKCESCTRELAREARLELELVEIAQTVDFCRSCGRILRDERCEHCGAARSPGGFVVERILVQTANGRVYLARDPSGQLVALKELVFTRVPDVATLIAFEREAKLLKQLEHPGIPRFIASFTEGEGVHTRLYLAQEYVAGVSLAERLEKHRFTEVEILNLADRVLEILVYLQHISPPIFHRDVKPANLVVRPDGSVVLVDFGAARDVGATGGASLVGTFGYMPPEQLVGIVDVTSDLYGLGATLAHVATRRPPWQVFAKPDPLESATLSAGMTKLIVRLCAPDPRDRFASAQAALEALRRIDTTTTKKFWGRWAAIALVAVGVGTGAAVLSLNTNPVVPEVVPQHIAPPPVPKPPAPKPPVARTVPPLLIPPRVTRARRPPPKPGAEDSFANGSRALVMGDLVAAERNLLECLKIDPGFARCHRALGVLYARGDETQKSLSHYRRYVELVPNAPDAERVRQMIEHAESTP